MKLVVGLGNPGDKYEKSRHNAGFMILDELARKIGNIDFELKKKLQALVINYKSEIILAKPVTFMNESGLAVKKLMVQYKVKLSGLWIIHDDLDIPLGNYKIQYGKGPREHKGLISIYDELSTKDFWHVRVGVDNRLPEGRINGEEYVLQKFSDEEIDMVHTTKDKLIQEMINLLLIK